MNTFADTPGRPTPKPSGKLDAVGVVKALLEHGAEPERGPERTDPREGARSRRRHTRRGRDTPHARREEGRRRDDAAIAGSQRRSQVEDEGGNRGVDVCRRARRSGTLHCVEDKQATEADFIDAATLCLERGADINASSENGQTALHLAVTVRDEAFIAFLIERGAKVDIKDKQGRTPIDVASGAGGRGRGAAAPVHESVVALLRAAMNRTSPN